MFEEVVAVKRPKLADEVLARLLQMIRSGQLKEGDRLPPERQLAHSFAVSRASLRDAVRQLEMLGYVDVKQGNGTIIRLPDATTVTQPFRSLLSGHPHLAMDLLEFRNLIEPQAAALAAQRCTPEFADRLRAALEAQRELAESGRRLHHLDLEFHQLIANITGNVTLLQVIEALQSLLRELRDTHLTGDRPTLGYEQHKRIAEAIIRGDGPAASKAMAVHLRAVEESLLERSSMQ